MKCDERGKNILQKFYDANVRVMFMSTRVCARKRLYFLFIAHIFLVVCEGLYI